MGRMTRTLAIVAVLALLVIDIGLRADPITIQVTFVGGSDPVGRRYADALRHAIEQWPDVSLVQDARTTTLSILLFTTPIEVGTAPATAIAQSVLWHGGGLPRLLQGSVKVLRMIDVDDAVRQTRLEVVRAMTIPR